jgi:hypothetical protein
MEEVKEEEEEEEVKFASVFTAQVKMSMNASVGI